MARPRKPATGRKPLAPKNTNIISPQRSPSPPLSLPHSSPPPPPLHVPSEVKQQMMNANHRELERRITAIRAVREAEVEGYLTSLRTALSMLSEEVRNMPLHVFVKKFCPDRECVKDPDSGLLKVMPKPVAEKPDFSGVSAVRRFESNTESQKNAVVQPTPRSFPFCTSAVREELMYAVDMLAKDEIKDEEFLKFMQSFKSSRSCASTNLTTPSSNAQLMVGMTPKTVRLPKKGEALLSINGSPLGVFDKDGILAIPEGRPTRARRLRASVASNI